MLAGRNDPCPCGSGRKYKQCCLRKEEAVITARVKEKHFFDRKYKLSQDLLDFLSEKMGGEFAFDEMKVRPFRDYRGPAKEGLGNVWMFFLHRYENGLRGIEWFLRERGGRYFGEERAMLERWRDMRLGLYQVVDRYERGMIVEDVLSKERLPMPYCETTQDLMPWSVSLAFMEPFEEGYCMHGVAIWASPVMTEKLIATIRELQLSEERNMGTLLTFQSVMERHYPSLIRLVSDHMNARHDELTGGNFKATRKVLQVKRTYDCGRPERLVDLLLEDEERYVLVNDEEDWKRLSRMEPMDRLFEWIPEEVREGYGLNDVQVSYDHVDIRVRGNRIVVEGFESDELAEVFRRLDEEFAEEARLTLLKEERESLDVPENIELSRFNVLAGRPLTEEEVAYFGNLPSTLHWLQNPFYDGKSLLQLLDEGRRDEVETLLRQREYEEKLYSRVPSHMNIVRAALRLPLSPFAKPASFDSISGCR